MDCSQIHLELPGLLYGELDSKARAAVESHLASCPQCKKEYESLQRTTAAMDQWSGPQAVTSPDELADTVLKLQRSRPQVFRLAPLLTGSEAAIVVFGSLVLMGANISYGRGGLSLSFGATAATPKEQEDGMNEYLLMLHEDPKDAAAIPPERLPKIVGEYKDWAGGLAQRGRLVAGEKLADEPGKLLSTSGEQVAVVDASWTGTDDIVTGFFRIRAESYEEAVEISRTCPHVRYGKHVELRQIERTE